MSFYKCGLLVHISAHDNGVNLLVCEGVCLYYNMEALRTVNLVGNVYFCFIQTYSWKFVPALSLGLFYYPRISLLLADFNYLFEFTLSC